MEGDYNTIFPDKKFDRYEFKKQILVGAKDLLLNVDENLNNAEEKDKKDIVENFIDKFSIELHAQLQDIVYFQEIIKELFGSGIDEFINKSDVDDETQDVDKRKELFNRLRKRIDEMIFKPETWKLPDNFRKELENQIISYESELKNPNNKKVYFPVGIIMITKLFI